MTKGKRLRSGRRFLARGRLFAVSSFEAVAGSEGAAERAEDESSGATGEGSEVEAGVLRGASNL